MNSIRSPFFFMGGLLINENTQVLNTEGVPIPGFMRQARSLAVSMAVSAWMAPAWAIPSYLAGLPVT